MKWSELEDIIIDSKVRLSRIYILFGWDREKGFADNIEYDEALGENGAVKDVAKVWENVTTLCNYMFTDGTIDVTNDLLEIRQMADELQHEAMRHESCKQLVIPCHKVVQNIDLYFKRKGITVEPQQKPIAAPQQPKEGSDGVLAGYNNETPLQGKGQAVIKKEDLPTIYDDENKVREQRVFYNAIQNKLMVLNNDGKSYTWKKNSKLLGLMCAILYWNDEIKKTEVRIDAFNTKFVYTLEKNNVYFEDAARLKDMFGGKNISNYRTKLHGEGKLPEEWEIIDKLL